ncbi:MAG: hypothetical protein FWF22_02415 [Treponema sp.]|nr:hypothetical protein [Treponema sp.]
MIEQPQTGLLFPKEQFRIYRLQVYNWGTFSNLYDIPISEQGFMFIGRSGSGKTTLLDAISTLLIPPRWIDYNAAARDTTRGGRDRSLVSYVRGAWAEQKDGESGEFVTSNLRTGTTWSALALSYRNTIGQIVVLVQIFWLRGNANSNADVRRHYLVLERAFDLHELDDFQSSNFNIRKLNQSLTDAYIRGEFSSYCEHFRGLLGIENEIALRLLHKTQSAKNLGDLNTFLRDYMLEKPKTFDAADTLVNEFTELNAAHQSVVTARLQIETLDPAREKFQKMESMMIQKNSLDELEAGIVNYREIRRMDLLKEKITSLSIEEDGYKGKAVQQQQQLENYKSVLRDLQQRHSEIGGDKIEQLENENKTCEIQKAERLRKRKQAEDACLGLHWTLAEAPQEFAELKGRARGEIEELQNKSSVNRDEQDSLAVRKKEAENELAKAVREVRALERQSSNIPAEMLELRNEIASAMGISDSKLPFAGELIEVKPDESIWQGAIERVLHGFALSVLVDENNYAALSNYINVTQLGRRLVYYRTRSEISGDSRSDAFRTKPISAGSLVLKLNVREGDYSDWLNAELRQRYDYACVDSVQAFRNAERALTREGQIKHSKTRHEKDDRHAVGDRHNWVLGFSNREKLDLFKKLAQEQASVISEYEMKSKSLSDQNAESISRMRHCQTLSDLEWMEIDAAPLLDRISAIEKQINEIRKGNTALQEAARLINKQNLLVTDAENNLQDTMVLLKKTLEDIKDNKAKFNAIRNDPSIVPLTPHQKKGLDDRYMHITVHIDLVNLDKVTTSIVQELNNEVKKFDAEIINHENQIKNAFTEFKRKWPADSGDLDATLIGAQDFFAKLKRLETDGLPAYEQKFFDLLRNQSNQNLAALSAYLNNERKAIHDNMVLVNDGLRQVPFNKTVNQSTYLCIDVNDRQLTAVKEFRQNIQQILSHALSDDRKLAEERFLVLRALVEDLSSQEPENKRRRELVLDVRQHVEFIGREIDEAGNDVEVYRGGAGKSGGQRQKLATTCLAAALRYQLAGNNLGVPVYAPVVLDEAFDRADNEYTALAMEIFRSFGFQMIVATPLKSVMTLEPFIGGACFVDINDRNASSVLPIEYDNEQQRLVLTNHAHEETGNEIS